MQKILSIMYNLQINEKNFQLRFPLIFFAGLPIPDFYCHRLATVDTD